MSESSRPHKLVIFGAGGHGKELAWLAQRVGWSVRDIVFAVDHPDYVTAPVNGIPVVLLKDLSASVRTGFVVALGDSRQRERVANLCLHAGFEPQTLIAPEAILSDTVAAGEGAVIAAGSILTSSITLGRQVHVNIGCSISHDCVLHDYATLSPGVRLSGHVVVESHAFLGTGAIVINGSQHQPLVIGAGAVVAAGACVTSAVAAGTMVAGVPAVRKR